MRVLKAVLIIGFVLLAHATAFELELKSRYAAVVYSNDDQLRRFDS